MMFTMLVIFFFFFFMKLGRRDVQKRLISIIYVSRMNELGQSCWPTDSQTKRCFDGIFHCWEDQAWVCPVFLSLKFSMQWCLWWGNQTQTESVQWVTGYLHQGSVSTQSHRPVIWPPKVDITQWNIWGLEFWEVDLTLFLAVSNILFSCNDQCW